MNFSDKNNFSVIESAGPDPPQMGIQIDAHQGNHCTLIRSDPVSE